MPAASSSAAWHHARHPPAPTATMGRASCRIGDKFRDILDVIVLFCQELQVVAINVPCSVGQLLQRPRAMPAAAFDTPLAKFETNSSVLHFCAPASSRRSCCCTPLAASASSRSERGRCQLPPARSVLAACKIQDSFAEVAKSPVSAGVPDWQ